MNLTWQSVVLITVCIAAPIVARALGVGEVEAGVTHAATVLLAWLTASPAKESAS